MRGWREEDVLDALELYAENNRLSLKVAREIAKQANGPSPSHLVKILRSEIKNLVNIVYPAVGLDPTTSNIAALDRRLGELRRAAGWDDSYPRGGSNPEAARKALERLCYDDPSQKDRSISPVLRAVVGVIKSHFPEWDLELPDE